MSIVVLYCWCHSDSASVLLYFTFENIDAWLIMFLNGIECSVDWSSNRICWEVCFKDVRSKREF